MPQARDDGSFIPSSPGGSVHISRRINDALY